MDANHEAPKTAGAAATDRAPAPPSLLVTFTYSSAAVVATLSSARGVELRVHCLPSPRFTAWEVAVGRRGATGDAETVYPRELIGQIFEKLGAGPLGALVAAEELEHLMAEATAPLELFRGGAGWLQEKGPLMEAHCSKLTRSLKLS